MCGLLAGVAAAGAILYRHDGELVMPLTVSARDCNIKGNISHRSGERTFHLPGQQSYPGAVIQVDRGERWFCAEGEALAAGWRRADN
ncbi:hypothetical protein [Rhizobium sp. RU36D]|uniref:sunset domain-containing protein n=1 Tax=Rhizobium sp. RU36D TaxID=1907415 RepID=UPI00117BCE36|nr:hypothetical protein [Rhizobium sp. RU36D]